MIKFFKTLIFGKNIFDVIESKKKIRVNGVKFIIQKIDTLHHMQGSKVLTAQFAEWTEKKSFENDQINDSYVKKLKAHYIDVFMSTIVYPEFSRKPDDNGKILVDHLLTDWEFATKLYEEIMIHTYGKKKMKQSISQKKDALKLIQ